MDDFVTALLTASRVLVDVSARALASVDDAVSVSQFRTLVALSERGPERLNRLSERLHVNASTALRTVDRLAEQGLVEREVNPLDRREVLARLTDQGRRVVDEVVRRRQEQIEAMVGTLSPERSSDLVEALQSFAAAADMPADPVDAHRSLGW